MADDIRAKKQAFYDEYMELCKKHGFEIVADPAWKPQIDQTFTLAIRLAIVEVKNREAENA